MQFGFILEFLKIYILTIISILFSLFVFVNRLIIFSAPLQLFFLFIEIFTADMLLLTISVNRLYPALLLSLIELFTLCVNYA